MYILCVLINIICISHNVCKSYLDNIRHVLVQNIYQEILYLLFGVCYMSAGGHFGKWPPRPPEGSSAVAPPPNLLIIY